MRTFFIFLFISLQVLALDVNDTMSIKVLDVLKNNHISINRGFSDGVVKNDHIRINSSEGYRSRGLVLYVKENFSIVKLYRVIDDNSFSRDLNYTLTSMNLSQLAPHMRKYLKQDHNKKFQNFQPRKSTTPLDIKNDLPKKTTAKELKLILGKPD